MIAVIADDLTGAAELGGIGLRQGLTVEVGMEVNPDTTAELLVIAADTRSMPEAAAVAEMEKITRQLMALSPAWIYKKTDSVLRGHVVAELDAQLAVTGWKKALLVAANPALGRTIQDGQYYLEGQPIHESSFAVDPEFAVTSSSVRSMLRLPAERVDVVVRKSSEGMAAEGITVGEVSDEADLRTWAVKASGEVLLAGAAGFFRALLEERGARRPGRRGNAVEGPTKEGPVRKKGGTVTPGRTDGNILFISGTTFGRNQAIIEKISKQGGPVEYMDAGVEYAGGMPVANIIQHLQRTGKAIVAIEGAAAEAPLLAAKRLRQQMADWVRQVLDAVDIQELVIEGGATAYAILQQAGWRSFFPEEELAPGVIRMRVGGERALHITVKPGSYEWPGALLQRLEN